MKRPPNTPIGVAVCNNSKVKGSVKSAESDRKWIYSIRTLSRGGWCHLYAGVLQNIHGENVAWRQLTNLRMYGSKCRISRKALQFHYWYVW